MEVWEMKVLDFQEESLASFTITSIIALDS
jgi:hypothetical protein